MSTEYLRLSQVLGYVKQAVSILGERPFWVAAEVLQISGSPHRYLELVEYDSSRRQVAKTRGMIWKDDVARILDNFQKTTGSTVAPGMKILIEVKPSFHEIHGLALNISNIDPRFTLGDMEAKIKAIQDFLREKKWYELNRQRPTPHDFIRVAVIAPNEAAGLGDFRVEADKLSAVGLCKFEYYHALFQGDKAPDSIVEQMIRVHEEHQKSPFCCLIIIRGGGDKAGLYHLNDRRLAVSVCRFPAPVFIGIGHERDKVFLEEIACMRFATPSLLISHIKHRIVQNAREAELNLLRLKRLAQLKLDAIEKGATELYFSLREVGLNKLTDIDRQALHQQGRLLSYANAHLDRLESAAEKGKTNILSQASIRLEAIEHESQMLIASVMAANPLAILDKGYGYVSQRGRIVTKPDQIKQGDQVSVTLKNMTFTSTVETIHEH